MAAILYIVCAAAVCIVIARVTHLPATTAAALILTPLLVTGGALFTGRVYAPVALAYINGPLAPMAERAGVQSVANPAASDVYAQFLPWHEAVRDAVSHHQWPLWDRFSSCGTILAGAVQSAPFHPINFLALLLPLRDAVTFAATMLFFTAALSMFLFLRPLVGTDAAAMFGAIAWMFSDYVITFAGTAHGMSVAVVPLLLLAARGVATSPSFRSTAFLTAALLLLVLSGHPETLLHGVTISVAYFFFELWLTGPGSRLRAMGAGLTAGICALLLSAFTLLPLLEAIPQTDEFRFRSSPLEAGIPGRERVTHHVVAELFPFIEGTQGIVVARHSPEIAHPWVGSAYAGTLVFAIAAFGLMRRRDPRQWFFVIVAIFGILIGVSAPGLSDVMQSLPVFSIAVNERMVWFAALAFAVLAARGVDEWLADPRDRDPLLAVAALMTAAAIGAAIGLALPRLIGAGLTSPYVRTELMRAVLPLLLAGATVLSFTPRRLAIGIVTLLLLVGRAADTAPERATVPRRAFYPAFPGLSLLTSPDPFRIVGQGPLLTPNTSAHYGLEDVRGYQAMTFARFADTYPLWSVRLPVWSSRVDHLTSPLLSMMNVRYALALPTEPRPASWLLRGSFLGYDVVENRQVLPRAFVPSAVHFVRSGAAAIDGMRRCPDFAAEGWIESSEPEAVAPNGPGSVVTVARGSHVDLRASMVRDGWIFVSEAAWKGWRATEEGRELPIRFANHAFIGIRVPAGEHHVRLVYRPRSFVIGGAISGTTAIACMALGLGWRQRRMRLTRSSQGAI